MQKTHASFIHAHHDVEEPHESKERDGARALFAHVPRADPEVMESIAVALLSLTAPGVCLRAEREAAGHDPDREHDLTGGMT